MFAAEIIFAAMWGASLDAPLGFLRRTRNAGSTSRGLQAVGPWPPLAVAADSKFYFESSGGVHPNWTHGPENLALLVK